MQTLTLPSRQSIPTRQDSASTRNPAARNENQTANEMVNSDMTCGEMFELLKRRGCSDLTPWLDEPSCSQHPFPNGGCKHPNEVQLIGSVVFRGSLATISRWEENGTLLHYLSRNPSANLCNMSTSICAGLAYLHEHNIVHGCLKGANILISQDGTPMLADFGDASLLDATLQFTQTNTGPFFLFRWAAPEILSGEGPYSAAGDIYSLGMIILEAFTSQIPFWDRSDYSIIIHVVIHKRIPDRPESVIPTNSVDGDKLWAILKRCWSYDPKDRPTVETVWNAMKGVTAENLIEITSESEEEGWETAREDQD